MITVSRNLISRTCRRVAAPVLSTAFSRMMALSQMEFPKEGITVPDVNFRVRDDFRLKKVTTKDLFANKRVVVFSLPGAYTPTCSSSHVPGYEWLQPHLKNVGIDDVICMYVKWGQDLGVKRVRMIADGNGEFTRKIGLMVDKSESGLVTYSMVVNNKVVEKFFIEPRKVRCVCLSSHCQPGDPFEVSDALTMLKYLAPDYKIPKFFTLFVRNGCPHCSRAMALLESKKMSYEAIPIEQKITTQTLWAVSGSNSTPQCFCDGKLIGDSEALEKFVKEVETL